jgi:hypothetical protein
MSTCGILKLLRDGVIIFVPLTLSDTAFIIQAVWSVKLVKWLDGIHGWINWGMEGWMNE